MKKFLRKLRHNQILNKIDLLDADIILDTSCQDGSFLYQLKEKHPDVKVSGIDISEKDIEIAKKNLPSGKFNLSSNKNIPYNKQSFDLVISSLTLHHMDNSVSSLKEMKRVLKEEGRIYLIDITYKKSFLGRVLNIVKCPEPYHFEKFYSDDEVFQLIKGLDLKISSVQKLNIFSSILIVIPVTIFELKIR